jgi:hypothetical protein
MYVQRHNDARSSTGITPFVTVHNFSTLSLYLVQLLLIFEERVMYILRWFLPS